MTLAIVFALVIVGLVVWDRFVRSQRSTRLQDDALRARVRMRSVQASPPRFKGNGRVPLQVVEVSRRPLSPRRDAVSPRASRVQGTRRRDPNAIGVACGRPIAECTRGEECLCLD